MDIVSDFYKGTLMDRYDPEATYEVVSGEEPIGEDWALVGHFRRRGFNDGHMFAVYQRPTGLSMAPGIPQVPPPETPAPSAPVNSDTPESSEENSP